ncbi:hypothetical protein NE865_08277 [Phthorimaea operculella]|nr:hypothetical protein NE865_09351 [Phthorimaea operculella]KAI5639212.1 hypothetical protein NE865_08277 [Phthorimaea operculella]
MAGDDDNDNNGGGDERTHENVNSISIHARVPEFWTDLPKHWFFQAEAILAPQRWTDEQKFQFIVGKLGKDVIQQVTDILITPPATGKFDALKNRLLEVYEESESRKIQKLMGEMDLGDQRPSQLLRRMKELARDRIEDKTLMILWQNHLPVWVRGVLAVSDIKDLNKLALMADKVMENARPVQVASVDETPGDWWIR